MMPQKPTDIVQSYSQKSIYVVHTQVERFSQYDIRVCMASIKS
jgi:hypothetical protein